MKSKSLIQRTSKAFLHMEGEGQQETQDRRMLARNSKDSKHVLRAKTGKRGFIVFSTRINRLTIKDFIFLSICY